MNTLHKWRYLLGPVPRTIEFPQMELISGRDHEKPILIGRGEVYLPTLATFEFRLKGSPADKIYAFKKLADAQKAPYDIHAQFRLVGVDQLGTKWAGGWTTPAVGQMDDREWTLNGELTGLSTHDDQTVSQTSGVELIYLFPVGHAITWTMGNFIPAGKGSTSEHSLDVLGTQIEFSYEAENRILTIKAVTSKQLSHPYAENWLSEPLRIMFGQLVFPRLVARNFRDGRAMISLRSSPDYVRDAEFAALWRSGVAGKDRDAFWNLYSRLLTFIAGAIDQQGYPNFEANKLTQFYEEIIQAARGSRWVWVLTLASAVEGLVKMLIRPNQKRLDIDHGAIDSLSTHISNWQGPDALKEVAVRAVKNEQMLTPIRALRTLRDRGTLTSDQVAAWSSLRNSVMHGSLVTPWASEEEDQRILDLIQLMHRLTHEVVSASSLRE